LCAAIDAALEKQPSDLAAFLSFMEQSGYEVKKQRAQLASGLPARNGLPVCVPPRWGRATARRI